MRQLCYAKEFIVFLVDIEFCRSVNDGLGKGKLSWKEHKG